MAEDRKAMRKVLSILCAIVAVSAFAPAQDQIPSSRHYEVHADAVDWHVRGDGVVCCPCKTPCPCRTNGKASYGHCEATLYLRVFAGHYGAVKLDGLQVVNTSGACSMSYKQLAALYFDRSAGMEEQTAFMKLLASFFPDGAASFPYVRTVSLVSQVSGDRLFHVSIPDIVEIVVDRNWGQQSLPFPMVAATDHFSNTVQYAQNLRYRMSDSEAHLTFDYSRRQANYRVVDLDSSQYHSQSMLIQFFDGKGDFNEAQMRLIREQNLLLPDLPVLRQLVAKLR
jgi:hypothetical protein